MLPIYLVIVTIFCQTQARVSYEGYKVYDITTTSERQNDYLASLSQNPNYDFWSKVNKVGKPVTLMVSPGEQQTFEQVLLQNNISFETKIQNVQESIMREQNEHNKLGRVGDNGKIQFNQYLRHSEINTYLEQLAQDYPDLVTLQTAGLSYENRTINYITISTSSGPWEEKPVIFVEAGNHAREWIAPAMSLYIANQLVENPDNRQLIENTDWVILPLLNPDGYEYTWDVDRFWRKTRSPGQRCDGVDGNRNYGFHWNELGGSNDECAETYSGPDQFSEVESRNLGELLAKTYNIVAFISLHSYGQNLIYPYSYFYICSENREELQTLGERINDAIARIRGTTYTVGCSTDVLYPAAGCTDDWAKGELGVDLVYVFELPGGGSQGFDLPPSQIVPVVIETFEGIKVISDYVLQKYVL